MERRKMLPLDRIASITVGTIEAISERWSGGGESSALST